jgi:hypothetical protein
VGKKIKKAVKKVVKVAVSPIKKVAIDPIKKVASSVGLGPVKPYDDSSMVAQQAELNAQQRQAYLDAQQDLGLGERATVLEGEAAAVAAAGDPSRRKRKGAGSLSEALGLGGL